MDVHEVDGWSSRIALDQIGRELWLVVVGGEQDLATVGRLQAEIERAETAGGDIVVDMSQATFIDSSIARLLIEHGLHGANDDVSIALVIPAAGFPAKVLQLLEVYDQLPAFQSRADALRALGR
ncbi:MAG TPA: STAS domain-containing protein [Gaiellales bacterium]|jgi:anti-sigma B factor antagonist